MSDRSFRGSDGGSFGDVGDSAAAAAGDCADFLLLPLSAGDCTGLAAAFLEEAGVPAEAGGACSAAPLAGDAFAGEGEAALTAAGSGFLGAGAAAASAAAVCCRCRGRHAACSETHTPGVSRGEALTDPRPTPEAKTNTPGGSASTLYQELAGSWAAHVRGLVSDGVPLRLCGASLIGWEAGQSGSEKMGWERERGGTGESVPS